MAISGQIHFHAPERESKTDRKREKGKKAREHVRERKRERE